MHSNNAFVLLHALSPEIMPSFFGRKPRCFFIKLDPEKFCLASIKKAREKELKLMSLGELSLSREALTPTVKLEKLELTPEGKRAELISGSAEEVAANLAMILKDSGLF